MRSTADLREYLEAIDICYFKRHLEEMGVEIGWLPSKSVRHAEYHFAQKKIRLNRRFAYESVPEAFVLFTIYHEALHAMQGASSFEHPAEFRAQEARFALLYDALMWDRDNHLLADFSVPKGLR